MTHQRRKGRLDCTVKTAQGVKYAYTQTEIREIVTSHTCGVHGSGNGINDIVIYSSLQTSRSKGEGLTEVFTGLIRTEKQEGLLLLLYVKIFTNSLKEGFVGKPKTSFKEVSSWTPLALERKSLEPYIEVTNSEVISNIKRDITKIK